MDRRIVSAGVLLASLMVAMPALAQDLVWTSDRPDGHAPAGVKADFTLPAGGIYVGFRYSQEKFRGSLIGTAEITSAEVLDFFSVATLTHDHSMSELDIRFGLTNFVTLEGSMAFIQNNALKETSGGFFETSSDVLGDVSVRALIDLLEMDSYRVILTLGATVPTGKIGKMGPTATSNRAVLPYPMQGGSGTPDILIGGTFQVQNDIASVGAQFNSVIRFMDNPWDYRLGNRYDFTVWGAYNFSDWVSFSMRGFFEHWGPITGADPRTDGAVDPLANPFAQGGERVVLPFGFNIYFREGSVAGNRLSVEFYYPIHEDLNGPQMSIERSLVISWQSLVF